MVKRRKSQKLPKHHKRLTFRPFLFIESKLRTCNQYLVLRPPPFIYDTFNFVSSSSDVMQLPAFHCDNAIDLVDSSSDILEAFLAEVTSLLF